MGFFLILFLFIILAAISIYTRGLTRKSRKKERLWQECRRLLRLPPKLADEIIIRYRENLKKHHPNRSDEWYLEKIIYDLERK